jgi:hypothetical protein
MTAADTPTLDRDLVGELAWRKGPFEWEGKVFRTVSDAIVDTRRWYTVHTLIFMCDDEPWGVDYRCPATEMQEWDNDQDLTPYRVYPVTVTRTEYVRTPPPDAEKSPCAPPRTDVPLTT